LVDQRITGEGATHAILERTYAEVPTSWSDYTEIDFQFPAFTGLYVAGAGIASSRTEPAYFQSSARVQHDYFFGSPQNIARPSNFEPFDANGNRTLYLTDTTTPTASDYEYYVAARTELVVKTELRRWMGDIWERLTYYVRAR
jgi:hypothetical protein